MLLALGVVKQGSEGVDPGGTKIKEERVLYRVSGIDLVF